MDDLPLAWQRDMEAWRVRYGEVFADEAMEAYYRSIGGVVVELVGGELDGMHKCSFKQPSEFLNIPLTDGDAYTIYHVGYRRREGEPLKYDYIGTTQ